MASLGAALFFTYCHVTYGQWDSYMLVQSEGWGLRPDYLAIFRPDVYQVALPTYVGDAINPNYLSRVCAPLTLVLLLLLLLVEFRAASAAGGSGWRVRGRVCRARDSMFHLAVAGAAYLRRG